MTPFYIGTEKDYPLGSTVEGEVAFFTDIELAKVAAMRRANDAGMLFGNVYEVSHTVDETTETAVRLPHQILRHVDFSI